MRVSHVMMPTPTTSATLTQQPYCQVKARRLGASSLAGSSCGLLPRADKAFGSGLAAPARRGAAVVSARLEDTALQGSPAGAGVLVSKWDVPPGSEQYVGPVLNKLVERTGAALLRNLPLTDDDSINAFFRATGHQLFEYDGLIVRLKRENGAKPVVADGKYLGLHTECAFLAQPPQRIAFYCRQPAPKGGETLLGRNRDFIAALGDDVLRRFEEHGGVCYHRYLPDARRMAQAAPGPSFVRIPWQEMAGTPDKALAESHFQTMRFETTWDGNDGLYCKRVTPATSQHEQDGTLWTNFAQTNSYAPYFWVTFGDGTEIAAHDHQAVKDALTAIAQPLHLQKGDLLVLDNKRIMHGRNGYTGTRKMVQVMTC